MFKYIRYLLILVTYLSIKIIGKLYNYLIIGLRHRARYAVYGYLYEHDKFFYNFEAMSPTKHISYLRYILWFILVWIWLDDNTSKDCIPNEKLPLIAKENPEGFRLIRSELSSHSSTPFSITKHKKTSYLFLKLSIDYQVANNFKHFFYYTTDKSLVFEYKLWNINFGYKPTNKLIKDKMVYKLYFKK